MTRGRMVRDLEPTVPIVLHGRIRCRIDAVLDTGFSDYVCLSRVHRGKLHLRSVGILPYELADGSRVDEEVFLAEVTFEGQRQRVLVTLTDSSDSLVGTALLRDCSVRIDFPRRQVVVRRRAT